MDADVPRAQLKQVVDVAFLLQRHLLRRAWGVLYAVTSITLFLTIFADPTLLAITGLRSSADIPATLPLSMIGSGSAFVAILWTFKRVRNTAEFRATTGRKRRWAELLGWRCLVPLWLAVNATVIVSLAFFRDDATLTVLMIYSGLALFLYFALTQSFPEGLPIEGIVTLSSFSFSSVASLLLVALSIRGSGAFVALWGCTILLWIASAIYSRTRPVPNLGEM